ncbi:3-methyladenine DNA glycosylase AlkD [Pseudobutyrivibrio sp. OR37]|uniref:DNA alkylation repair protein n=1 Tax=Pseudobutyrivibrio sp. OR37 TaxID=1798186 RepID=UPI0008F18B8C|nr:DNA alkylation repair protein [Pseudobutyrivibrio sp. OR37]SFH57023.1 3-methyladenine DNA glycosylase AlkD [Pseudobutyrivibrio sp. OR37]
MIVEEIKKDLFANQDIKYRDFQSKLTPTIAENSAIGVRTPLLRKLAKKYYKREDVADFLNDLPHQYFDENQLHAFIISETKDFDECIGLLERFLPYVDNWATCDQMSPKCFKKNHELLKPYLLKWLQSDDTYTVRFAIVTFMSQFLDDDFDENYLKLISEVKSDEYYINMAIAWYFATALAKQYDSAIAYIENNVLDTWTHNKTIQKAIESYRVTDERKSYLKSLKRK